MTIPSGTASGTYLIVAMADNANVVPESNEHNNIKCSGAIKVVNQSDLVIGSMYVTPTSVSPGGSVSVTALTANQSVGGTAGASTTGLYLSAGSTCPTSVSGLTSIGSISVGSLGPSSSSTSTISGTIPGGTASGTYR